MTGIIITKGGYHDSHIVIDSGRRTGSGLAQHEQFYHVEEDQVKINPSIIFYEDTLYSCECHIVGGRSP